MERFWTVYGKEPVGRTFNDRETAEEFAQITAKTNPGVSFAVMECVSAFKCPVGTVEPVKIDQPWTYLHGWVVECPVPGDSIIEVSFSLNRSKIGLAKDLWPMQDNGGPIIHAYRVLSPAEKEPA